MAFKLNLLVFRLDVMIAKAMPTKDFDFISIRGFCCLKCEVKVCKIRLHCFSNYDDVFSAMKEYQESNGEVPLV